MGRYTVRHPIELSAAARASRHDEQHAERGACSTKEHLGPPAFVGPG